MRDFRRTCLLVAVCLAWLSFSRALIAVENWPQWRGPDGAGVAADGDYPASFSDQQSVTWKVALPGPGSSTPAVWGDSIFVTCEIDGEDAACCYGFDGSLHWEKRLGPGRKGKHRNGTGANPSPVTDGKHLVVYYKSGLLAGLDFDGNVKWTFNLQEKYGEDTLWWDLGSSPVIAAGKAIVAVMQAGTSYLVGVDLESGELAWHQPRMYSRPEESDQAYTTPTVVRVDGMEQVVVWGADHLTGHDPATGEQLWECGGFNPKEQGYWRVIASQAIGDDIAVVPYGRGKYLAGVRLGGQGDVTASNRIWQKSNGTGADVPTPVVRDGQVFLLTDRGGVFSLDLATGEQLWSFDLPRSKDKYYASPVLAGDKLYCTREDGMVFAGKIGNQFELLAANDMQEQLIATPIPVRNGLLIRGLEHLYRIE